MGDALGATNDGRQLAAPPYPTLADGIQRDLLGGGPLHLARGQVTNGTQMACCIAEALRELKKYDAEDVVQRYLAWRPFAFELPEQVKAIFEKVDRGMLPQVASREAWMLSAKSSATNGSLMRTTPIGVFFSKDRDARIRASLADSALTHWDPRCQLACVALNGAIAAAIHAPDTPRPEAVHQAALSDVTVAAALLGREAKDDVLDVREATQVVRAELAFGPEEEPELYGPDLFLHRQPQQVRIALRLAFWQLFHAPSPEAALIDIVNRGGDSDTNAAVTGALLGAVHGESAFPEEWRTLVTEALAVKQGPLWFTYHPNQLLLLVE